MRLEILGLTAIATAAFAASGALAQDSATGADWTGFYVGGQLGYSTDLKQSNHETVLFDRNLDGAYGDAFTNFSPGFCPGAPAAATASAGCGGDSRHGQWKVAAGYDRQFGTGSGFVVGGVVDAGKQYYVNYVTAFSTTPANYVFGARLGYNGSARIRAGYTLPTGTLFYGTGGVAYGKINNFFLTSNTTNTFTGRGTKEGRWGYVYGGGIEQKVGHFSVGMMYNYTSLKNNDYVVRVSGGAVGGPFTVQNVSGTDLKRSRDKFTYHSALATVAYHF